MTVTVERLEQNIQILDYDIKELEDMMRRYATCGSPSLIDIAKDLRECRNALLVKRTILVRRLNAMTKDDDFLQDYREVLAQ